MNILASVLLAAQLFVGISDTGKAWGEISRWNRSEYYAECVRKTGNVPVFVPMTTNEAEIVRTLARLDVLIMTGGEDVDPARYRAARSPKLGKVFAERDDFDFALMRCAVARRLPIFGVCRGVQVMNVYFGGTLWQDLPSEFPVKDVRHSRGDCRFGQVHEMDVVPGSRLESAFGGGRQGVNSQHHQAVRDLAPGFRVAARATDGVVEAIESDEYPAAGVQFHPEELEHAADGRSLKMYSRILELCGARKMPDRGRAE